MKIAGRIIQKFLPLKMKFAISRVYSLKVGYNNRSIN